MTGPRRESRTGDSANMPRQSGTAGQAMPIALWVLLLACFLVILLTPGLMAATR